MENKLSPCSCHRHPDSAFTVTQVCLCPRCGGTVENGMLLKGLVPLDQDALFLLFYEDNKEMDAPVARFIKSIVKRFGASPQPANLEQAFKRMEYILHTPETITGDTPNDKTRLEMIQHIIDDIRKSYSPQPAKVRVPSEEEIRKAVATVLLRSSNE